MFYTVWYQGRLIAEAELESRSLDQADGHADDMHSPMIATIAARGHQLADLELRDANGRVVRPASPGGTDRPPCRSPSGWPC